MFEETFGVKFLYVTFVSAAVAALLTAAVPYDAKTMFERTSPSLAKMTYEREGNMVVMTITASGIPNGASTAADCAIMIRGLQGGDDVVRGEVVPWFSSTTQVTSADIGPDAIRVDVLVGPEGARVTDHGAAAKLCGLGSQLDGLYQRVPG